MPRDEVREERFQGVGRADQGRRADAPGRDDPREVRAKSRFLIYQNRVEAETYLFAGKRIDTLRRAGASWKLVRREIILEQNVLQAKNLSVFF